MARERQFDTVADYLADLASLAKRDLRQAGFRAEIDMLGKLDEVGVRLTAEQYLAIAAYIGRNEAAPPYLPIYRNLEAA